MIKVCKLHISLEVAKNQTQSQYAGAFQNSLKDQVTCDLLHPGSYSQKPKIIRNKITKGTCWTSWIRKLCGKSIKTIYSYATKKTEKAAIDSGLQNGSKRTSKARAFRKYPGRKIHRCSYFKHSSFFNLSLVNIK